MKAGTRNRRLVNYDNKLSGLKLVSVPRTERTITKSPCMTVSAEGHQEKKTQMLPETTRNQQIYETKEESKANGPRIIRAMNLKVSQSKAWILILRHWTQYQVWSLDREERQRSTLACLSSLLACISLTLEHLASQFLPNTTSVIN